MTSEADDNGTDDNELPYSPETPEPAVQPIPRSELKFYRKATQIKLAAVLLRARTKARENGLTDEIIAERMGWSVKKLRRFYLKPEFDNGVVDMFTAMHAEIEFSLQGWFK
jgi:hypothetical protein